MSAAKKDRQVTIGVIGPAFGIQGWVHVQSFTDPLDNLLDYPVWSLHSKHQSWTLKLEQGRIHGKGLAVKFEGCNDRDQAMLLRGAEIQIQRDDLPALEENEFYWSDLEGLTVESEGKSIGTVEYLYEAGGAGDVMVVKDSQNKTQHIPFSYGDVVTKVDLELGIITIDWVVIE